MKCHSLALLLYYILAVYDGHNFVVLSITEKPGQLLVYCYYHQRAAVFCVLPETKRTRCIAGRSRICCGRSTIQQSRTPTQNEDICI